MCETSFSFLNMTLENQNQLKMKEHLLKQNE